MMKTAKCEHFAWLLQQMQQYNLNQTLVIKSAYFNYEIFFKKIWSITGFYSLLVNLNLESSCLENLKSTSTTTE